LILFAQRRAACGAIAALQQLAYGDAGFGLLAEACGEAGPRLASRLCGACMPRRIGHDFAPAVDTLKSSRKAIAHWV